MALTQWDLLKSMPYSANPSGRYYWTSTCYVDSDDFPNELQMRRAVYGRDQFGQRQNVRYHGHTMKQPPGRGNIVNQVTFGLPTFGNVAAVPDPSLLMVARWSMWDAFGRKTYRLVRFPLGEVDIEGDYLSAAGYFQQQAALNTYLFNQIHRNKYGHVLVAGIPSKRVHMWQLRHGTKRARSSFWLP